MRSSLDTHIDEWAKDVINSLHHSGFPPINAIEKILRDPGISTDGGKYKILWWPRNRRVARMSRIMHRTPSVWKVVLIVDSGYLATDDGQAFDKKALCVSSSLTPRKFEEHKRNAKSYIRATFRESL